MNIKKLTLSISFVISASVLPSLLSVTPLTDMNTAHAETKTKRVPALRNKVYSQLARAQKLADDGQVKEGLEALDNIKARSSSMNAYEVAMMYNFYGFIYYNENQLDKAIESFEKVISEEQIPESLKQSTTFSLAQLAMANNDYEKVIIYLDKWKSGNTKPITNSYYVLRANAHYLQKQYREAIESINVAINLAESKGEIPKENWLVLQRALYYSLNQPEQVVVVLEKMVKLYNKPEYWVQLGGMYGEVGDAKKQLAILEAAKQQGFIKSKNEIMQLAQVYMYNGLNFKAAEVLKEGISNGKIENSAKNQAFIAEAFVQAKEDEKSIPHFKSATEKVDHGNYAQRLAEVYLNLERYEDAADFAREALNKGNLTFESNAYVALGMAQYNLENFDASILAFEQAEKHKKSQRLAKQWIKFVEKEKLHSESLKKALL
ncbi:hypothetical protein [Pseudoalteromonas phenolica]|uniref:hypothetical protein n=1 Tax=Pseudoalteromonas phenolica TaxID=161398 RepID=UPI003850F652